MKRFFVADSQFYVRMPDHKDGSIMFRPYVDFRTQPAGVGKVPPSSRRRTRERRPRWLFSILDRMVRNANPKR